MGGRSELETESTPVAATGIGRLHDNGQLHTYIGSLSGQYYCTLLDWYWLVLSKQTTPERKTPQKTSL